MSSTYKTEHLQLNSWEASDRPVRNDFNSDNLIIDQVLGEHVENEGIHLTTTEKARVSRPRTLVGYAGNGNSEQLVTLPVTASAVFVYREDMPLSVYDSAEDCTKVYAAFAFYGGGATSGLRLTGTGLTVYQGLTGDSSVELCLNEKDGQYKVIVLR